MLVKTVIGYENNPSLSLNELLLDEKTKIEYFHNHLIQTLVNNHPL